jgi:hypothetical protein
MWVCRSGTGGLPRPSAPLENKQTGRIIKTAREVAVPNDKIARRYSGLAERLGSLFKEQQQAPVR